MGLRSRKEIIGTDDPRAIIDGIIRHKNGIQVTLLANHEDNEIDGFSASLKVKEGFVYLLIVHKPNARLFTDSNNDKEKKQFIDDFGGPEDVEVFTTHAGETAIIFKNDPREVL